MVLHTSTSRHLTKRQGGDILNAIVNAYCANRQFNEFLTLHLQHAGVSKPHLFLSRFIKHVSDWHRRHFSEPLAYLWLLENPPVSDDGLGGLHVHFLLHIPISHWSRYRKSLPRWISQSGGTMRAKVLDRDKIGNSGPRDDAEPYLQEDMLRLARYFLKGIDPTVAAEFGVEAKDQGVVTGRRFGYSQLLRKVRGESGRVFVRRVSPQLLKPELHKADA